MALVLNDRVKETSTTTGQGTLSLAGAATGFETFVAGIGDDNTTYYAIVHATDGTWEIGIGTVNDSSPDELARTTVIDTSAGNTTKISFASGTKNVFCTLPSSKAVFLDADGDVTLAANLSVGGNLDVTGTFDLSDSNFTNAGDIQLDSITGDGDTNTKITFSGSDVITVTAGGDNQITFTNGAIVPSTDNDIDLGTSSVEFKDAFFDGTVTSDAFAGPLTGDVTGNVSGTAATVTGAAQSNITSLGTLTTLTVDNVIINGTTIGHTDDTDLMTVADGVLTVAGEVSMTTLDIGGTNVTSTAAELNLVDGITAGTVSASLAVIADSNKDISGFRNVTLTGELDAATLDLSGDADIAGTTNLDNTDIDGTLTVDGTAIDFNATSTLAIDNTNTSNGITIGTSTSGVPISIGHSTSEVTVNDNLTVTGNFTVSGTSTTIDSTTVAVADAMFKLAKDQGTSADALDFGIYGQYGVGGTAKYAGIFRDVSATGDPFTFFDTLEAEPGTTVNTSGTGYDLADISAGGATFADNVTITGDADVDGTLEADAITVNGTTLAEFISDTAGAMVGGNTETGITVTYQDGDNTIDFELAAAQTTITSLLATDIKIGEDDQTKIDFETADEIHFYAANVEQVYLGDNIFGPQSDSDVDLGSTGVRWKDAFVDSITVTGEVDGASLDISGNADIDGTLEADAITVDGTAIGSLFASQGDATALAIALG